MVATSVGLTKYLFHRIRNHIKAEWNYLLAHVGIMRFTHKPVFISVEPANYCQLHCPECPVGTHRLTGASTVDTSPRRLSVPLYKKALREVMPFVHTIQFYFQGEPLLNPDLCRMIKMAHWTGIYTIVSTNAQLLTEDYACQLVRSRLNRIIVSMDGLTQSTYEKYRQGGDVEKVYAALRYLRAAKKRFRSSICIELQCLRLSSNEAEWKRFKQEYRRMGADCLSFKTAQFYSYQDGNPLMPSTATYSRYKMGKDGQFMVKRHHRICRRLFMGCVLDVDGNVLPCCFDKSRKYPFGNLQTEPFQEVWDSLFARRFRERVLGHRRTISICQNCTE